MSSTSATATSRCWRACSARGARGRFRRWSRCHGGAWCLSDRTTERLRHQAMAAHGIVSIALDFRSGNEDPYPASVAGHQLCGALGEAQCARAQDPAGPGRAYPASRAAGTWRCWSPCGRTIRATRRSRCLPARPRTMRAVRCVVMSWPVINPLSRYRLAKRARPPPIRRNGRSRSSPARTPIGGARPTWRRAIRCSRSSAARRCSPRRRSGSRAAATRCTTTRTRSSSFPGNEPQRFVDAYRKAGGEITLEYIDAERHAGHSPDLSKTGDMFERMVAFVGRHIKVD